jgi:hypothetical protein
MLLAVYVIRDVFYLFARVNLENTDTPALIEDSKDIDNRTEQKDAPPALSNASNNKDTTTAKAPIDSDRLAQLKRQLLKKAIENVGNPAPVREPKGGQIASRNLLEPSLKPWIQSPGACGA